MATKKTSPLAITMLDNNFYFGNEEGSVVDTCRSNLTDPVAPQTVKAYLTKKNMGELITVNASDNVAVVSRALNKQEQIKVDAIAATFGLAQDIASSVNENRVFMDMMEK